MGRLVWMLLTCLGMEKYAVYVFFINGIVSLIILQ